MRRADACDIPGIMKLLGQVNNVHAEGRPDLFVMNSSKYTESELEELLTDHMRPVFVLDDKNGGVAAYCFCVVQDYRGHNNLQPIRSLYIDDLCVDEKKRGQHLGETLYREVREWAKNEGFYNLTLNVWACNPGAEAFYRKMGMDIQKTTMESKL